jgi:hypothetical protein
LVIISTGIRGSIVPQDTNRARVKHQGKREFHGISEPALGKSTEQMAMSNEYNIAMLLAVHVTPVNVMYLCNEIVNTVGDFLRRSIENASVYSPFKADTQMQSYTPRDL